MANAGAHSSKQNQSNIDESQRDTVKKHYPRVDPEVKRLERERLKQNMKSGLIKRRRSLL